MDYAYKLISEFMLSALGQLPITSSGLTHDKSSGLTCDTRQPTAIGPSAPTVSVDFLGGRLSY